MIAKRYSTFLDRSLTGSQNVVISSGATEALLACISAYVEPSESVIFLSPVFQAYEVYVNFLGANTISVPLCPPNPAKAADQTVSSANDWTLSLSDFEAAITTSSSRVKVAIITNPYNPIGKVWSAEELRGIAQVCARNKVILVMDEVYSHLSYENGTSFTHAAGLSPECAANTLTIGSVGKAFNCNGWRTGWIVGSEALLGPVRTSHMAIAYSVACPAQKAAAVGLVRADETNWWHENREERRVGIEKVLDVLDNLGIGVCRCCRNLRGEGLD